ncbi:MAG: hypothetical protein CL693_00105 [Cellvibrionaceae bacterium]|nr:hypothetical protein [Cellvibrionaceae bacterium]|tara:strand:- start:114 stop:533 length:420 start_codon:yes stop_codon:yes gene_type:complete
MDKEQLFVTLQKDGVLDVEISRATKFLLNHLSTYYATIHSDRKGLLASAKWLVFHVFKSVVSLVNHDANDLFEFTVEHRREIEKYGFPDTQFGKVLVRFKRTKGVKLSSIPANRKLKSKYFENKRKELEGEFGIRIRDD